MEKGNIIIWNKKKETFLLVADYAENEKNIVLQRLCIISFIGLCAISFIFISLVLGIDIELLFFNYSIGLCYGLTFGAFMTTALYSTEQLFKIRQYIKQKNIMKMVSIISFSICVILFVLSLLA